MDELAAPGDRGAARRGASRFHPASQHRFAIESLENAPDWCVSRQLWWGHQIPIWTLPRRPRHASPGRRPTACAECGAGLGPAERSRTCSTPGSRRRCGRSPRSAGRTETPELERYYPGDVNVTAREIIRLWENRMIFSGLFLLGEVPFTDVIITSTVLAVDGRRMSKSLGTGIDPLEAVDQHGADATRYGLLKMSSTQDVRFSWGAIEEGQKLANKLWNVSRLILQHAAGRGARTRDRETLEERWILAPDRRHARRARARCCRRSTSRTSSSCSTTSSSTTSATGTPRRSSRGSTRATRRRSRRRSPRSSGCSRCCTR